METELIDHLRKVASAYGSLTGQSAATIAQRAFLDWRFLDRLSDGSTFTVRKFDRGMQWFSANWPPDAAWPDGVPRPAPITPSPAVNPPPPGAAAP